MVKLRLTIELVPSTSWYNNMRKVVSRQDWDVLRRKVYADYGHRCGLCGASGRLNCHEVWEYDDKRHIQTLVGFIALCDLCHHIKHIGLARILADEGKLSMDDVVAHFCKVNGCDYSDFLNHEAGAWRTWESRSKHNWEVFLGKYADLVSKQEDADASKIFDMVGHPFDMFSNQQVALVLFTELALPRVVADMRFTNDALRKVPHPVAKLIAQYRELYG